MYGGNHIMMPATRVLLERLRAHYDTLDEEGRPCQLTSDEIVARGLDSLCREAGISGHVCAADLDSARQ